MRGYEFDMDKKYGVRDERKGGWSWIYNRIISDPHITPSDKIVYLALATFAGCETIRPSIQGIAKRCNRSIRTVQRVIRKLDDMEIITISHGGGELTNEFVLLKKAQDGCKKCRLKLGETDDLIH